MPKQVDRFPGAWAASLDWGEMADGGVWLISNEEMDEHHTKPETVRVYAHQYANNRGFKFKTKYVEGDGLYVTAIR